MRSVFLAIFGLLQTAMLLPQELVRNPAKPLNPEAGRILRSEPVYRIDDSSGEFYLKNPFKLQADTNGCLYILDGGHLLKFSPEGKFVRDYFKSGQGPGEISTPPPFASFAVWKDEIHLFDGKSKFIRLAGDGKLVAEARVKLPQFARLLGVSEDGYFIHRAQPPADSEAKSGFVDYENEVLRVSFDGKRVEKIAGFTHREWQSPDQRAGTDWSRFIAAFDAQGRTLYVSHTCEYGIVRSDLAKGGITARWTREYPRVEEEPLSKEAEAKSREQLGFSLPKKDFRDDILALYVCDGNLWVHTSGEKNRLIDVFDRRGRYIDSFVLPMLRGPFLPADGGLTYYVGHDIDGNWVVLKLKTLNGPKAAD